MKYSRILIIVGICCVVGLLLVLGMHLHAQDKGRDAKVALNTNERQQQPTQRMEQSRNRQRGGNWGERGRSEQDRNWRNQERSENTSTNENEDYYNVIVNNNIFRPLGWRPPNKEPEYSFIAAVVYEDESKSEGCVLETRSNRFFIAGIGDKIGDAVVTGIKKKEILLDKNGEKITLKLGNQQFLQTSGSRRGDSRGDDNRNREDEERRKTNADRENEERKQKEAAEQRRRQEWAERSQEMRRRWESSSRGDRERMMREFRERGGFRGRR